MHKIEENVSGSCGIPPQIVSATAASATGAGVSLATYNNFALGCQVAISTSTAPVIFYIVQSTDGTTYDAVALATCTLTAGTTATSDVIEVRAEQLADGRTYVRGIYVATAANTYQYIAALNARFNPRFAAV